MVPKVFEPLKFDCIYQKEKIIVTYCSVYRFPCVSKHVNERVDTPLIPVTLKSNKCELFTVQVPSELDTQVPLKGKLHCPAEGKGVKSKNLNIVEDNYIYLVKKVTIQTTVHIFMELNAYWS